jgi:hypothetical protein
MERGERLNFIRQKCIAANPDIVALDFGCEVSGNIGMAEYLNDPFVVVGPTSVCKKHKRYNERCSAEENGCETSNAIVVKWGNEEGWGTHTVKEGEAGKILGRPIRLADVLLAFSVEHFPKRDDILAIVDVQAALDIYWAKVKDIIRRFDLRADDLEKQPEETVDFIYSLLK